MLFVVFAESRSLRSLRYPSTVTKEHPSGLKDANAPKTLSRLSRPTGEGQAPVHSPELRSDSYCIGCCKDHVKMHAGSP